MEEKKNGVKPENENKVEEKAKQVSEVKGNEISDEYAMAAFDDSEVVGVGSATEKVFVTKYPIQRRTVPATNGEIYDNYAIAFLTKIGDTQIKSVLRIRPKRRGGAALAEQMKIIMDQPGEHMLEITKTVMTTDTGRSTVYSMSVSCVTADGATFSCPLEPVGVSDKSVWDNFKRQLIARGQLE